MTFEPKRRTALGILACVTAAGCARAVTGAASEPEGASSGTGMTTGTSVTTATTSSSSGGGGDGGTGEGGFGGEGNAGGTGGLGGAGPVCGNGVAERDEACDGDDFGGETCVDFGLPDGELACNEACGIVVSACIAEDCTNSSDDDADGDVDCFDSECAPLPACSDSCASPMAVASPLQHTGDTTNKPDVLAASCSGATSAPEIVYVHSPSVDEKIDISIWGFDDFSLSVRSSCGDASSEAVCSSSGATSDLPQEKVTLQAEAGKTYFIVVEGVTSADVGTFTLLMLPAP